MEQSAIGTPPLTAPLGVTKATKILAWSLEARYCIIRHLLLPLYLQHCKQNFIITKDCSLKKAELVLGRAVVSNYYTTCY